MRTFGKDPARTSAQVKTEAFSNRKCMAGILETCSKTITKEHYISKNILDAIGTITLSGASWLKSGETRRLDSNSLGTHILCETHNTCLSELDRRVGHLFRVHQEFDRYRRNNGVGFKRMAVHHAYFGQDFEKWLIKTMLGFAYSGDAYFNGKYLNRRFEIPIKFLQVLYSNLPVPEPWGVYIDYVVGDLIKVETGITLQFLEVDKDSEVFVAKILLLGNRFIISLGKKLEGEKYMYRPNSIGVRFGKIRRDIRFIWS